MIVSCPVGNAEFGKQTPVKAASVARRGEVLHFAVVTQRNPEGCHEEGALPDVCGRMMLRPAQDSLELHGSGVPLEMVEHPSTFLRSQVRPALCASMEHCLETLQVRNEVYGNNGLVSAAFVLIVRIPALAPRFRSLRSDSSDMRSNGNCSCHIR